MFFFSFFRKTRFCDNIETVDYCWMLFNVCSTSTSIGLSKVVHLDSLISKSPLAKLQYTNEPTVQHAFQYSLFIVSSFCGFTFLLYTMTHKEKGKTREKEGRDAIA